MCYKVHGSRFDAAECCDAPSDIIRLPKKFRHIRRRLFYNGAKYLETNGTEFRVYVGYVGNPGRVLYQGPSKEKAQAVYKAIKTEKQFLKGAPTCTS